MLHDALDDDSLCLVRQRWRCRDHRIAERGIEGERHREDTSEGADCFSCGFFAAGVGEK